MNYQNNPYAPPQAAPLAAQPVSPFAGPQPWSVGEIFSIAWERFKQNWAVLVFTYLLTLVITQAIGAVPNVIAATGAVDDQMVILGMTGGVTLFNFVVSCFFYSGLTRIWLEAARGQTPSFGTMFTGGDRFFAFLIAYFLLSLVAGVGFLLLVVPGVILLLGLGLAPFYVVDAKMGPIAALQASWAATKGQKGDLFVALLASMGVIIVGLLACGVGMFVAAPICYVAYAVAYTRISGNGVVPRLAAPAGPPGYPMQQPAYGPPGAPGGYGPPGGGYGGPPGGGGYGPPGGGYGPPGGGGGGYGPPPGYGGPQGPGGQGGPPPGGYGPPPGR
jgi:hypothetical protein